MSHDFQQSHMAIPINPDWPVPKTSMSLPQGEPKAILKLSQYAINLDPLSQVDFVSSIGQSPTASELTVW